MGYLRGYYKVKKGHLFLAAFLRLGSRIPVETLIIDLQVVLVIWWGGLVDSDSFAGATEKQIGVKT